MFAVVVLTSTHRYNEVRGQRTGSSITLERKITSGCKQINTEENAHNKTDTNRTPQTKKK